MYFHAEEQPLRERTKRQRSESRIMHATYKRASSARCLVSVTRSNSPFFRASVPADSQPRDS